MKPRQVLRKVLKNLTATTVKKHKPDVLVVTGKGQTSIVREALYWILHEKNPTRRNLEYPEAELSVPLTVLGNKKYPDTPLGWIRVILKTIITLAKNKSYKHILILEISNINRAEFEFWIDALRPVKVFDVPEDIDFTNKDLLARYLSEVISNSIKEKYEVNNEYIYSKVADLSLPSSKLKIEPGKNESVIIDSTYYYYPNPIISALEVASMFDGKKVVFTEFKKDLEYFSKKGKGWTINPKNYSPENSDVILLRVNKVQGRTYVKNFT